MNVHANKKRVIVLLSHVRALSKRMRFRWYPRLAEFRLNYATKQARRSLRGLPPLGILVDNTILDLAVTHGSLWINTGSARWSGQARNTGYLARVPVYGADNKTERYLNVKYLTGIAHLARIGAIKLYQSAELESERFRQPVGRYQGYGFFDYSLFSGINIESVDGWVFPTLGPKWMRIPTSAEQQRARIDQTDDQLFQNLNALLKEQLGPKKGSQDAWHIRTAERYELFCFLTTDGPLLKACKNLGKKEPLRSMSTRVLSPEDLGHQLGIHPVSPTMLSYTDASWIVRTDRTMPGERRRRGG